MRLTIRHQTSYQYDAPVQYALQQLRLTPKDRAGQRVLDWQTDIVGGRPEVHFDDHHHNHVVLVGFNAGEKDITITSLGEVETEDRGGIVGVHAGFTPLWFFSRSTPLTAPGPHSRQLVRTLRGKSDDPVPLLHELSQLIGEAIAYETGHTHAATASEAAIEAGHGVCQDHAHVFVTAARLLGFPARYVSGYLMMNDRVDQDASHAWAEAHVPGVGWIGFDPSNGICPDARYVCVATGLDYTEAAPISGMRFGDAGEQMIVSLQVQQ